MTSSSSLTTTTTSSNMEADSAVEFSDTRLSLAIGCSPSAPPPPPAAEQRRAVVLFGELFPAPPRESSSPATAAAGGHTISVGKRDQRGETAATTRNNSSSKKARTAVRGGGGDDDDGVDRWSPSGGGGDDEGANRKKLRLSREQATLLEESFSAHNILSHAQKHELAGKLGLSARQVEVWFQNRRARTKLKQTEADCEILRRWCERLADENARLRHDLADLRSSSFYSSLSAAAVCSSCAGAAAGEDTRRQ
uniref:Homeobox domain-containing protein n=1 Tax=Leersia perrieri TaxID=77586 RepID=A0A0D9VC95_9ORYZ